MPSRNFTGQDGDFGFSQYSAATGGGGSGAGPVVIITTFAGTGTAGFSGDGAAPTAATFQQTAGIVADTAGNIYLCDIDNNRIRAVNMQGTSQTLLGTSVAAGTIQTVAGSSSTVGFADATLATNGLFGHPCYLNFDSSGNLYIADQQSGGIRKVSSAGVLTTPIGSKQGHGTTGDAPGYLTPLPPVFSLTSCTTASGGNTTYTGTVPTLAQGNGLFVYIYGFANAANNGLFQTTSNGNSTQITVNNASGVAASAQTGFCNYTGLAFPQGVVITDSSGSMLIADSNNNTIVAYNQSGSTNSYFGTSLLAGQAAYVIGSATTRGPGLSGDGGPALSAFLSQPIACRFDNSGNLLIADYSNSLIRRVTPSGTISTIAGTIATIQITGVTTSGSFPVYTYTGTTIGSSAVAAGTVMEVTGMQNSVNNGHFIITALGTGTFTVSNPNVGVLESGSTGSGKFGQPGYGGDGGPAVGALLAGPQDVAVDSNNNIYVAEAINNLVRQITPGGAISTYAGNFNTYGTSGAYAGDNGLATLAGLKAPVSLYVDTSNNVYVGDFSNNVFRKIFTITGAPTVTSVTANTGGNNGGQVVTVTGTNFWGGSGLTVTFGGVAATAVTCTSSTTITCTTPPFGGTGAVNVTVTEPNGKQGTGTGLFTYSAATPAFVSSGISGASTPAVTLNTTGATLLVVITSVGGSVSGTVTDSQNNLWNYVATTGVSNTNVTRIAYAFSNSVGGALNTNASHVITPHTTTPACAVYAFSGTLFSSGVLDVSNFATGVASSALQAGSITPSTGDLLVFGFGSNGASMSAVSVNDSFIGLQNTTSGASLELVAGAYLLNATNSAINPQFTATTGNNNNVVIAAFK